MFKKLMNSVKNTIDKIFKRGNVTIKNEINGFDNEFTVSRKELSKYKKESKRVEKLRKKLLKKIDQAIDPNLVKVSTQQIVKFVPAKNIPVEKITNKIAFDRKLEAMQGYRNKTFFVDRAEVYRQNIITSLGKVYHSNADELIALIRRLTTEEIQLLLLQHPGDFSIDFIYLDGHFGEAGALGHLTNTVKSIVGKTL